MKLPFRKLAIDDKDLLVVLAAAAALWWYLKPQRATGQNSQPANDSREEPQPKETL
jgi:hypothetical protein